MTIFLTDQSRQNAGNLWVWPGSHRRAAGYLRERGPEALLSCVPYPSIDLGQPRQVTGQAGDLLLAHYMLGHNSGGNTSDEVREALSIVSGVRGTASGGGRSCRTRSWSSSRCALH